MLLGTDRSRDSPTGSRSVSASLQQCCAAQARTCQAKFWRSEAKRSPRSRSYLPRPQMRLRGRVMQDFKMLIGGDERAAVGGEWTESINPYTRKGLARGPPARADDAAFSATHTRLQPRLGPYTIIRPP